MKKLQPKMYNWGDIPGKNRKERRTNNATHIKAMQYDEPFDYQMSARRVKKVYAKLEAGQPLSGNAEERILDQIQLEEALEWERDKMYDAY